jgi:hypothetical protein
MGNFASTLWSDIRPPAPEAGTSGMVIFTGIRSPTLDNKGDL